MVSNVHDVNRTLSYGKEKHSVRHAAFFAFGLALGIFSLWTGLSDLFLPGLILAIISGPALAFYLYRVAIPGIPFLVLSPDAILMLIDGVKQVKIPWSEVHGVDSITVTSEFKGPVIHPDVTVFLVTRDFYNRHLHVDSYLLQGPNWDAYFIPKGGMMQVALHHSILPATAQELREAVETRWKAFGKRA